jgi:hypothetical protein
MQNNASLSLPRPPSPPMYSSSAANHESNHEHHTLLQNLHPLRLHHLHHHPLSFVQRYWFLFGVAMVIGLAWVMPSLGSSESFIKPEFTIKILVVSFIFFNCGLSIKTSQLKSAILNLRLLAMVQLFALCFIPICVTSLMSALQSLLPLLDVALFHGFVILSCMPSPVSSAIIMTKAVGGNEAASVFNSAFGRCGWVDYWDCWDCWVAGLLGCWITGLLGCWVAELVRLIEHFDR